MEQPALTHLTLREVRGPTIGQPPRTRARTWLEQGAPAREFLFGRDMCGDT
jgi:hypothetical protein